MHPPTHPSPIPTKGTPEPLVKDVNHAPLPKRRQGLVRGLRDIDPDGAG